MKDNFPSPLCHESKGLAKIIILQLNFHKSFNRHVILIQRSSAIFFWRVQTLFSLQNNFLPVVRRIEFRSGDVIRHQLVRAHSYARMDRTNRHVVANLDWSVRRGGQPTHPIGQIHPTLGRMLTPRGWVLVAGKYR